MINSLYFKLLQYFNVNTVFYYRLLSIVGFLIFFYSISRLLELFKIRKGFILFIIIAPYFCFFPLVRGYSFVLGCFAFSLLYLIRFINSQKLKYEYLLIVFGTLSTLSLFSFLFSFLSIVVIYSLVKLNYLKNIHSIILFLIVLLVCAYVYCKAKMVKEFDPNIIGLNSIFKYGTISSIISDFSFYINYKDFTFYKYFKLVISISIIIPLF